MGKNKNKKTSSTTNTTSNDPDTLKVSLLRITKQNLGNEEYAKGNYDIAIELYTKALEYKKSEIYFSNRKSIKNQTFQAGRYISQKENTKKPWRTARQQLT